MGNVAIEGYHPTLVGLRFFSGIVMKMFIAIALTAISTSSYAQSVDCKAVKDTTVPVQMRWHIKNESRISQIYRDDSGNFIVWNSSSAGVTKATLAKGLLIKTETTSHSPGKYKSVISDIIIEGLPENFDRRSNAEYTISERRTFADDTTFDVNAAVTYKFRSSGMEKVGSCDLFVVHGEIYTITDIRPDQPVHQPYLYFPELRFGLQAEGAVVDDIQTTFTPLKPIIEQKD